MKGCEFAGCVHSWCVPVFVHIYNLCSCFIVVNSYLKINNKLNKQKQQQQKRWIVMYFGSMQLPLAQQKCYSYCNFWIDSLIFFDFVELFIVYLAGYVCSFVLIFTTTIKTFRWRPLTAVRAKPNMVD